MSVSDWKNTLFCGSFEGETDLLSKVTNLKVFNTGVGLLDALYNLQKVLSRTKEIKSIIFLGSGGAYTHSVHKIGDIVYSNKFVYKEIAEVKGMVKVPDIITKHLLTSPDERLFPFLKKFKVQETITNSTNYITLVDLTIEELVDGLYDIGVENMEAFSIAYVANKFSIAFTSILYITNYVGSNGSLDWKENWRFGSTKLQKEIIRFVQG